MPQFVPLFFPGTNGRLFCQRILPDSINQSTEAVLIIPPFAEEMNKSRRMLVQQAWMLAEIGYAVYFPDLFGTGDSEGDFSDATWEIWCEDISNTLQKISDDNITTVSVIALRMGGLLLDAVFDAVNINVKQVVLWHPVVSGEVMLNQFYRLKLAADMVGASDSRLSAKEIKQVFAQGGSVEIAGYTLNPMLVNGIDGARLENLAIPKRVNVIWYEIIAGTERKISQANQKIMDKLVEQGNQLAVNKIVGLQFWSAVELVDVPDLISSTTLLFDKILL